MPVVVLFSPGIEVGTSRRYIVLEGFAHAPALCAHVALVGTWQGQGGDVAGTWQQVQLRQAGGARV